jgi:hypothetical protein
MGRLGRRSLDVLVADALYLRTSFVDKIEALGLDWVITLKANQPELLAEAERVTAARLSYSSALNQDQGLQLWYLPRLNWMVADRDVTVVKTVRQHSRQRQHVEAFHPWRKAHPQNPEGRAQH